MSDATTPCPGVATFDYNVWSQRYPALACNVGEDLAESYFDEAGLYLNNTPMSIVRDVRKRAVLLGMLVAHLATLNLPTSQGGLGGAVGRVASASRGSVSISTDLGPQTADAGWFNQTQYGAAFWVATRYLRQMSFVSGRSPRPRIWP
ncbi:DUF4054 domain-containing protein [Acetobacter sp.]|uniref:DUF4054 domain-containing protein n=1 Tax=Acetobacter sp. TaxID=440 RepID=UPI0039EB5135